MLTGIVLAKNEAENLSRCLGSLKFCDEVIVIVDSSTDKTSEIAKKAGAKVLSHQLKDDYSAQRNWALEQATTPWVLFVDADEVVADKLASEIKTGIAKIEYKGFILRRTDFMWGKTLKHGDVGSVKLLRLGRRGAGRWRGVVHETWDIEGRVGYLQTPLRHYPHPSMVEFLKSINYYSTLKAREFHKMGRRTNIVELVFGPPSRFIINYLFKLGFLDGTAGFIHAMTMAFYSFLTIGKLWLLYKGIDEHKWVTSFS